MSGVPEECDNERDTATRRGARYYQAMTAWLESRERSWKEREKVSVLAKSYHKALQLVHRCLKSLRSSPSVEKRIRTVAELEAILERDREILDSRRGTPPLASDEA